jgi:hypothetical protein
MIDNDLQYDMIELAYVEQELIRDLILNSGKGNIKMATQACYKWVRKHTKLNRAAERGTPHRIHGRTGRRYLPEFNPPKSLIHYESLYDGRGRDEVNAILREGYGLDDFEMTWSIYLDEGHS